ncbi:MAG: serine--tRNA ligase, partial [Mucilaginibacter sp.]
MLQVSYIRDNREQVLERLAVKNFKQAELVDEVIALDNERRSTQTTLDNTSAEANAAAKQIGELMRTGKRDEAEGLKAKTGTWKEDIKKLGEQLAGIEEDLYQKLVLLPNLPHSSVPKGLTPEENEVVLENGAKPSLPENALPHWELAAKYNLIDFELGVKITGAGFPVYKNKGAKLQRALINYFIDEAEKAGYSEVSVPLMVNEASGFGTGQLPDKEG